MIWRYVKFQSSRGPKTYTNKHAKSRIRIRTHWDRQRQLNLWQRQSFKLCGTTLPVPKPGISIANIADFSKPPEKLSYPQQIAVTCTGLTWSRYSTVITPKNWNLFAVNIAMAGTGLYQLSRNLQHDYFSEAQAVVAQE